MLHKNIRKFLSNIGKKGGKTRAETEDMKALGKLGGLQRAENIRKGLSTDKVDRTNS